MKKNGVYEKVPLKILKNMVINIKTLIDKINPRFNIAGKN